MDSSWRSSAACSAACRRRLTLPVGPRAGPGFLRALLTIDVVQARSFVELGLQARPLDGVGLELGPGASLVRRLCGLRRETSRLVGVRDLRLLELTSSSARSEFPAAGGG
jgi:hypothetical protein